VALAKLFSGITMKHRIVDRTIQLLTKGVRFLNYQAHEMRKSLSKPICYEKVQDSWPIDCPLVSIVIPCYNYGKYVEGAINSVLAQTFMNLEILVIDDGSTDIYTIDFLKTLSCPKTRVIQQINQGLAETRNNGAAAAVGKYVCYLDADDLLEPTYLEKTLTILESDESLGSCYTWVQCFGDINSVWQTQDLEPFTLKDGNTAPSHSVIRKQAWEDVKRQNGSGFLTKYNSFFEDWVFWIDIVQCGYRGQVIKEPLIRYRVHGESLGAQHRLGAKDRLEFENMLEILHDDRKNFFQDRTYRRNLEEKLNRRILIVNNRINLLSNT
jgi:O-antigen biosynthesis protein